MLNLDNELSIPYYSSTTDVNERCAHIIKPKIINAPGAKIIKPLLKDSGKTIMIATHDINNVADRFDEVLCLNRHCCAYGDPLKVFTQEVLSELYGTHSSMFETHEIGNHGKKDGH